MKRNGYRRESASPKVWALIRIFTDWGNARRLALRAIFCFSYVFYIGKAMADATLCLCRGCFSLKSYPQSVFQRIYFNFALCKTNRKR